MLLTNVCQDKLAAAQSVFTQKGMMQGSTLVYMTLLVALHGKHPLPFPIINKVGYDDHGAVTGPQVMNAIKFAACPGKSFALL